MRGAGTSDDDVPLPDAKEQRRANALTKHLQGEGRGMVPYSELYRGFRQRSESGSEKERCRLRWIFKIKYEVFRLIFSMA